MRRSGVQVRHPAPIIPVSYVIVCVVQLITFTTISDKNLSSALLVLRTLGLIYGPVVQLGEHLLCKQDVASSNLVRSTTKT